MDKRSITLLAVCAFLFGVITGFLYAPVKRGIQCGNNNGNITNHYYGDREVDEDLDQPEDDIPF